MWHLYRNNQCVGYILQIVSNKTNIFIWKNSMFGTTHLTDQVKYSYTLSSLCVLYFDGNRDTTRQPSSRWLFTSSTYRIWDQFLCIIFHMKQKWRLHINLKKYVKIRSFACYGLLETDWPCFNISRTLFWVTEIVTSI